ncbi:M61 family metallopeptidase [Cupriavidus taiwanensis]|uniref:Putative Peptidase M61, glycyl monoaminopeptidase n=1 Tax=Cupriavidus taiwanensis TaxID=164546 RepID=A0A7Z7J4F1_9BURK|nr:M61 family metallopeptidase [Cupriavidus taiwanensis]SOY89485.1 putative Peptidase M61, glycyl monoaminopeptidase [Cupriavidus taiwanensis]SOZ03375.1 putative Peptidase M61, glycyl monoaminopeptidase [Cupriavidus taiwanensis]SOZ08880.1 putative Peptidase M61, glycyl monoaminopeptidase [Cupriavidus taiwanensis]SPC07164.1 putative Peptidase M61, glycyl monoaminopeptidase [Cupriavidus taiwanensis]SPD41871.1 putative Peptidase M61, glycyl monoaminopeptidase [Cupriavidus taiwanensis]
MTPIRYAIAPLQPEAHLFAVTVTVSEPDPAGQCFSLPAWIPGSYMIRDFARNIVRIRADAGGREIALAKLDKQRWQAAPVTLADGPLTLSYEVYAWDLSVRAAHLDTTHGFFNGSSVFLCVEGQAERPCTVDIHAPAGEAYRDWRVATAMREAPGRDGAKRYGFGRYQVADYDELVDHPVEMGTFQLASFRACGAQHDVVFTGRVPQLDLERVCRDLKRICETQIRLFEPRTAQAPFLDSNRRYVFMTMVTSDGYGGLEHRASTALICSRNDLPVRGDSETSEGYRTFLGLCSHEYFHTWNVKRIKPAAFVPYRLAQETYTPLLWLFEGFTSYYDDLVLVRSGCVTEAQYVEMLAKTWNGVLRGNGRTKQSVSESSFDAWTKYYRQDENAPNAIVSYYTKGALVALVLDLTIRDKTRGRRSLDDVMRALWRGYGRGFYAPDAVQRGVTEAEVYALFDEVTGLRLGPLLRALTEGTGELPLAALFKRFGIKAEAQKPARTAALGIKVKTEDGWVRVTQVLDGGAAQAAGLSAGDLLVAVDGVRMAPGQLDKLLARYRPGDRVELHAFRRDELQALPVTLAREPAAQFKLKAEGGRHAARSRWLGQ